MVSRERVYCLENCANELRVCYSRDNSKNATFFGLCIMYQTRTFRKFAAVTASVFAVTGIVIGAVLSFATPSAFATDSNGDIRVHVTREGDSAVLSGASVTVACPGGSASAPVATNGSGEVVFLAGDIGAVTTSQCDDGEIVTIVVTTDGYVTKTRAADLYATASPNVFNVTNVLFGVKITVDDEMIENNLVTGATVTTGASFGVTCSGFSGSTYYCVVPDAQTAADVTLVKDGYVTQILTPAFVDRTTGTDAQQVVTGTNLQHAVYVNVTDELGIPLTGATVQTGNGATTSCDEDGATASYYCAVPLANTLTDVVIAKDGYVQQTASSAWTDRTLPGDTQRVAAPGGLNFSHRISVTREGDAASVSGATVTVGAGPISCTASGSYYYCAVPELEDGSSSIMFQKTGYISLTTAGTLTDRTTPLSPQGTETVANVQFQLKVVVKDQLGTTTTASGITYGGAAYDLQSPIDNSIYYFAQERSNALVQVSKSGFVNNTVTNGILVDVSTDQTAQTVVLLSAVAANNSAAIGAGGTATVRGLEYKLKSLVLRTQLGGSVSDIASGSLVGSGSPSANVAVSASGGATITATAVESDVVYVGVTGDGGGDDVVTLRLSYVTADLGTADLANFADIALTDSANAIATGPTTAQKTFATAAILADGTPNIDGVALKYPLAVTVADELDNALALIDLSAFTYNGSARYATSGSMGFFANTSTAAILVVNKTGFVPSTMTNTGFLTVPSLLEGQTIVSLGASPTAASITSGIANSAKGLAYLLKSGVLKTEVGGTAIATIAASSSGFTTGGTPSADVMITGANGANIIASAVANDVIYIAATGDGAVSFGQDIVTVQLTDVSADGGAGTAALVRAVLTDTGDYLLAANTQRTFDIGTGGSGVMTTTGFLYPLKVSFADQLGNPLDASAITTKTFNAVTAYTSNATSSYWGNTGDHALVVTKTGFLPGANTNSGFSSVVPTQNAQTAIILGTASPVSTITADTTNSARGLTYALRTGAMRSEVGASGELISSLVDSAGFVVCNGGDLCTSISPDIAVSADGDTNAQVIGGAVSGDVVYLAATGDGAANGDDLFLLAPLNVTAGTGVADAASFAGAIFTDTAHTVNTGVAQGVLIADPASAGGSLANTTGYQYPLKVVVTDELGAALTISGLDAITFQNVAPYVSSTNVAYFGHVATNAALIIRKDGYVGAETTNAGGLTDVSTDIEVGQTLISLGTSAIRTTAVAAGTTVAAKGLQFGLKVTVQREGDNAAVSGATVTAGNSYGVTCTENSGTGIHYCPILLAQTGTSTRIVKDAYLTKYLNYTDRTAYSSVQGALTAVLVSPGDITAPTVTAQTPSAGSTSVSVGVSPTIIFNEAMDSATLNGGTIKIRQYSDDSDVTATILYNPATFTVTLDPDANLSYSTQYYLYAVGAKDASGNTVATDYSAVTKSSHEFTTAANTADVTSPTVTAQTPVASSTSVALSISPTLTFSEAMDASTLNGGTVQLRSVDTGSAISSVILYNPVSYVVTLDPVADLTSNSYYYLWVSGATDLVGNTVTAYTTTSTQQFLTVTDTTSLRVTGIDAVDTFATAGGGYDAGWSWDYYITASTTQTAFKLKFSDFLGVTDSIAVASNIRFYSAQASAAADADHAVAITAVNTYSAAMTLDGDLDSATPGRQVKVTVQMKVPTGAAGGSYSGSYGVETTTP